MPEVIARYPSSSSDAVHEVKDPQDGGPCWCTCMGWKMSKRTPKQCTHLMRLVGQRVLDGEFRRSGVDAPPVKSYAAAAAETPIAVAGAPKAMLAYPIEKAPQSPWGDDRWVAELKIDGMRLFHVVNHDGSTRQYARSGNQRSLDWLNEVALPPGTILDGELAAAEIGTYAAGMTKDVLFVFDVLQLGGRSLEREPWTTRRQAVEMVVESIAHPKLKASTVLDGAPDADMVDRLFALGGEGLMLKRRDSLYAAGKRSWDWLKAKGTVTYDVVIVDVGGEPTSAERKALGWKNLRYGLYRNGVLEVVGSIGSSAPPAELAHMVGKVVEVKGYGQSAETGAIRHPLLLHVRDDKRPEECTIGGA